MRIAFAGRSIGVAQEHPGRGFGGRWGDARLRKQGQTRQGVHARTGTLPYRHELPYVHQLEDGAALNDANDVVEHGQHLR